MTNTRVLLTGAAGFVGSHVLRHLLVSTNWTIVCPVSFRHRGRAARLRVAMSDIADSSRVIVLYHDLRAPFLGLDYHALAPIDYVLNIASESHVDRSITDPGSFIRNNVELMTNLLDLARELKPSVFLHMSTDEVYGPARKGQRHREWDPIAPSNPYSASKAAQEAIAFSYWRTYDVPVIITNTMNIIGETQDAEKFVPSVMRHVRAGTTVSIHADLRKPTEPVTGSRHWLHARNLADAWLFILQQTGILQTYPRNSLPLRLHVVGDELDNLELASRVASAMGQRLSYIFEDFHVSRPGHDLRYALDGTRLASMGWKSPVTLDESIERTVAWTLGHPEWLT